MLTTDTTPIDERSLTAATAEINGLIDTGELSESFSALHARLLITLYFARRAEFSTADEKHDPLR